MAESSDQKMKHLYEFGPFRVDPEKELLLRDGETVAITPKTFQILLVLMRHSKEIVTKEDMLKTVWPDTFVEEANLTRNIFLLRKALGETPQDHQYVVTVPGRGYRFAEEVQLVPERELSIVAASHAKVEVEVKETRDWRWFALAGVLLVTIAAGAFRWFVHPSPVLTEKDTVVLADFANSTGDPVFDDTLREGMAVQLEQSPYLTVLSDQRIQQTLRLMAEPAGTRLSPEIAWDICERTRSAAVADGSIHSLGTHYVLALRARNCRTGDMLDEEQAEAGRKEDALKALDQMASRFRTHVGESIRTVEQHDIPLEEATTPSLEALKAFSSGRKVMLTAGDAASIPFYKRALELDPNFVLAYAWLGVAYTSMGEPDVAAGYTRKAYEMRARTSEPENYFISTVFHKEVTGNVKTAEQSCEVWKQAYPRSEMPHVYLSGAIYPVTGQYEQAVEEAREALRLNPDSPLPYAFLMLDDTALNRLDEAKATHQQALGRKLDSPFFHEAEYEIAFLHNDRAGMEQQVGWSEGRPGEEDTLLGLEADTAAYSGRLGAGRELSRQASDSAERSGEEETAANHMALSGLREALFGNAVEARRRANSAVGRSAGRDVEYGSALALAFARDDAPARALTGDLAKRFPEDTIVQFNYLPTLRAQLALSRGNASQAIGLLEAASPFELGQTTASTYGWTALYPVFVRGEAFLAAGKGSDAAAEFRKIIEHRGIVLNEPIGALARLGLARAYALQGDSVKARAAYQDFLTLWKGADPDIPILKQAQAEHGRLR